MGLNSLRMSIHKKPPQPIIQPDQIGVNFVEVLSGIQQEQQRHQIINVVLQVLEHQRMRLIERVVLCVFERL